MSYLKEILKTIPFTVTSKTTICSGINLTKEVKYLYTENYKALMKEIEENTNKYWKSSVLGLEELILLKCLYHPKRSTNSMPSLSKFYWHFSQKWKNDTKICMEPQKTLNSQSNLVNE